LPRGSLERMQSEGLVRLRERLARASEGSDVQRELGFLHWLSAAIARMGTDFARSVDPGAPPSDGQAGGLAKALTDVRWIEEQELALLSGHQDDINALLRRRPHGRLTRDQLAMGERRHTQEATSWAADIAGALGIVVS
jgi:hypothetical protein